MPRLSVDTTSPCNGSLLVSFADLYSDKLVAALDRQHPRGLFDVRDLLANEGIDDALRRAFIVYLLSHDRPMSEVLRARRKDSSVEFLRGFDAITKTDGSLSIGSAHLRSGVRRAPAG